MQNEGQVTGLGLNLAQTLEGKTSPVGGVHAVDVADAAGEEVDTQVSDLLALSRISELAAGGHAVLGAADAADLGLDGHALEASSTSSLVRSRLSWKVSS